MSSPASALTLACIQHLWPGRRCERSASCRSAGPRCSSSPRSRAPQPGPTEVLVRVTAAGVNPVDWKVRARGGFLGEPPFTVGWDVAGVVEELGRGVTRFAPGDRVFGMPRFPREAAAYAEYVTAPSRQLARIPDGPLDEEAAALPLAGLTAWQALVETAGVGPRHACPRSRGRGRGRAPRGADREGARCVRHRHGPRGEARLPRVARGGRGGRLHDRAGRGRASATWTSCSTSSAATRRTDALATLRDERHPRHRDRERRVAARARGGARPGRRPARRARPARDWRRSRSSSPRARFGPTSPRPSRSPRRAARTRRARRAGRRGSSC